MAFKLLLYLGEIWTWWAIRDLKKCGKQLTFYLFDEIKKQEDNYQGDKNDGEYIRDPFHV